MKYISDFKKYRKSDIKKYKNISNEILQSERADLICIVQLLFLHIFNKFKRKIISISPTQKVL